MLGKEKSVTVRTSGLDADTSARLTTMRKDETIAFGWQPSASALAEMKPVSDKAASYARVLKMHNDKVKVNGRVFTLDDKAQVTIKLALDETTNELLAIVRQHLNKDTTKLRQQTAKLASKLPFTEYRVNSESSAILDECSLIITRIQTVSNQEAADAILASVLPAPEAKAN